MAVVQKRVDECTVAMTSGRVNDQPGRFVDDNEMLVFKDYIQRDILRDRLVGHGGRDVQFKCLSGHFLAACVIENLAVNAQSCIGYEPLNACA